MSSVKHTLFLATFAIFVLVAIMIVNRVDGFHVRPASGTAVAMSAAGAAATPTEPAPVVRH
ncbi:hypothetical protein [Sphingomonas crocodyli]|uniref:Uncharacterized protein n=1 Tax=Sphingomonas crocodyli TaxID=1979270 RepID=A0A437LYF5_9SPHN|nr:hypothetical protein [Sphingomonas crocodyli]RVT90469.1 hypothetical protein EOD43_19655 [Sphingomonas crocodyli]